MVTSRLPKYTSLISHICYLIYHTTRCLSSFISSMTLTTLQIDVCILEATTFRNSRARKFLSLSYHPTTKTNFVSLLPQGAKFLMLYKNCISFIIAQKLHRIQNLFVFVLSCRLVNFKQAYNSRLTYIINQI